MLGTCCILLKIAVGAGKVLARSVGFEFEQEDGDVLTHLARSFPRCLEDALGVSLVCLDPFSTPISLPVFVPHRIYWISIGYDI